MALRSSIKILSNTPQNVMPWSPALVRPARTSLVVRVPLEGNAREFSCGRDGKPPPARSSCAARERPACAPPCAGKRACCRARFPRQPPAVRVRCCPPGAGCRPPCRAPPAACPLTCLNRCAPLRNTKNDQPKRSMHTSGRTQGPCKGQNPPCGVLDSKDFVPPLDPPTDPNKGPYSSEKKHCPVRPQLIVCQPRVGRTCSNPAGSSGDPDKPCPCNTGSARHRQRGDGQGLPKRAASEPMHFEDEAFSDQIDRVARRLASDAADRRMQYELEARIQECHRRLHTSCADEHADECRAFLKKKCIKEKCCTEECRDFCSKCENPRQENPGQGYTLDIGNTVDATGIDGKLYSLRPLPCEKWGDMKTCGPNRETPPPEYMPLKPNQNFENCQVKDNEFLDPCGHKPSVIIDIDRSSDPKKIARENEKKISMQLRKENKKKLYQKIQKLSHDQQKTESETPKSKPQKGFTDRIKELTGRKKKDNSLCQSPDVSKYGNKAKDCRPCDKEGTCARSICKPSCNSGENANLRVGDNSWCSQNIGPKAVPEKCVERDFKQNLTWRKWQSLRGKCEPVGPVAAPRTISHPNKNNVTQKEDMSRSIPQVHKKNPCKPYTNKPSTRCYHTSGCRDTKLCGYNFFPTKKGAAKPKTYAEILKQTEEDIKKFKCAMSKRDNLKETGLGRLLGEDMCPCAPPKCPPPPKPCVGPSLMGCLKIQMPCEPDDKKIRVEMCIDNTLLEFARAKDPCSGSETVQEVKKPFDCPKGGKLPTLPPARVGSANKDPEKSKSDSSPCKHKTNSSTKTDATENCGCQKNKEALKKDDSSKKQPPSGHTTGCGQKESKSKSETNFSIKNVFKSDNKKNSLCEEKSPPKPPNKTPETKDPSCKFSFLPDSQSSNPNLSLNLGHVDVPKELTDLLPDDFKKILRDLDKYEAYIDRTENMLRASEEDNIRKATISRFTILKDFLWSKLGGSSKTDTMNDPIVW